MQGAKRKLTSVPVCALIGISLLCAVSPCAGTLRFRGRFNGSDDLCIYLDTAITVTLTAQKGDKEFKKEFTDRDMASLTHRCENEPVENVAFVRFRLPNFFRMNGTGGRLRYMYSAVEPDHVRLDRTAVVRPAAFLEGLQNPDKLVVFRDPNALRMGNKNSSFMCNGVRSSVFEAGDTKDGYVYSLEVRRSYFKTQAFNIIGNTLGPTIRCADSSTSDQKAVIILSCFAAGVLVVGMVAAAIVQSRRRSSYSDIS
ncbi:hypothetical protein RRG08_015150 [Elysia crispata]|uniref:Uncharacterized protein n=1 Tax=Elysia crispata TaxID=231223 RepID=A0AAE1E884_9GAST|nr:hypothetical protein RRG08_015150 [Elysia crispata]